MATTLAPATPLIFPAIKPRKRTAGDAWLERTNPLTRLSLRTAQSIYDSARSGSYARIQYIYSEIEKTDPTLLICVKRRLSALSGLGWRVVTIDETPEAAAQKDLLEKMLDGASGLAKCIEHLGRAAFCGHAFAAPYVKDGHLCFELPPSWEFNYDPIDRQWWHNPLAIEEGPGGRGQVAFDPDDTLHLFDERPIDYPALAIFIRHEVAEDQWGRFLERYGIPPVLLEMPPQTSAGDADRFAEAAQKVYEALCGALPNGTKVNTLAEARGADPFSGYIEHTEKTLVRLCTGGTLGSIAEAGSGTLAGNAQADVWRDIVRSDAVMIGEEFTRYFGHKLFPGGCHVRFELGTDRTATPDEIFDLGGKAKTAGYRLTKDYLEEETGCKLEIDAQNPQIDPQSGLGLLNSAKKPLQNAQEPLQNAPKSPDGQGEGSVENALVEALSGLFEKELTKTAQEAAKKEVE